MGNKLKKEIKNKWVDVKGMYQSANGMFIPTIGLCVRPVNELFKVFKE